MFLIVYMIYCTKSIHTAGVYCTMLQRKWSLFGISRYLLMRQTFCHSCCREPADNKKKARSMVQSHHTSRICHSTLTDLCIPWRWKMKIWVYKLLFLTKGGRGKRRCVVSRLLGTPYLVLYGQWYALIEGELQE